MYNIIGFVVTINWPQCKHKHNFFRVYKAQIKSTFHMVIVTAKLET